MKYFKVVFETGASLETHYFRKLSNADRFLVNRNFDLIHESGDVRMYKNSKGRDAFVGLESFDFVDEPSKYFKVKFSVSSETYNFREFENAEKYLTDYHFASVENAVGYDPQMKVYRTKDGIAATIQTIDFKFSDEGNES